MTSPVAPPPRVRAHAARSSRAERRRFALTSMIAVASASLLLLLHDFNVGPAWVHWLSSLVAVSAAFGVVVMAQLMWERAINTAESDGLVGQSSAR
jgi:hypothetical protein